MTTTDKRIFIANHEGMLGAALRRQVSRRMQDTAQVITCNPEEVDFSSAMDTGTFLRDHRPTHVYIPLDEFSSRSRTPGKTGHQFYELLIAGMNLVEQSRLANIRHLVLIGDSCVYPAHAPTPLAEDDLHTGKLRPECDWKAIAMIALFKLCEQYTSEYGEQSGLSYRCMVTASAFGPRNTADPEKCDIVEELIKLVHSAKQRGASELLLPLPEDAREEFIFADEVASAAMHLMSLDNLTHQKNSLRTDAFFNVGYGQDIGYGAMAHTIAGMVGFKGKLKFAPRYAQDQTYTHRLDSHRIRSTGWQPELDIEDALSLTYIAFLAQQKKSEALRFSKH